LKKLAAILIMFFFLFNSGGYFILFKWKQEMVRQEIRQKIKKQLKLSVPSSETVEIVFFPGEKINWVKPEKEFWHQGDLFDVITKEYKNDTLIFKCINDIQEKALFANLDELVQRQQQSKNGNQQLHFFKIIAVTEDFTFYFLPLPEQQVNFVHQEFLVPSISFEIPTPPPELV
jgi:hypothetical protein